MDKKKKKIIVALFGAAGVGKDTLQKEIIKQSPDLFHEIISTTTRPPREYEKNGIDYTFISDDEYEKYLKENAFLEHADFRGWHYGTLATSIKPNCFNILLALFGPNLLGISFPSSVKPGIGFAPFLITFK